MSAETFDIFTEFGLDARPDSELTREQVIARNMKVVDWHFHSENPDEVEKAVALYDNDITWEAPSRGIVMTDRAEILQAYRDIFRTMAYRKTISLRRYATERFVFDDQIAWAKVVGDPSLMPGMPYPLGTEVCVRLVHLFEMRDGRITREIAYEVWREADSEVANDDVPEGSEIIEYDRLLD